MAKKIEWLDNFAEKYAKDMKKTAGKIQKEDIIINRSEVNGKKLGDVIKFQGRLYKIADLEFEDEKGPGVVLNEVGLDVPTGDPMSMSMGTEVSGLTGGQSAQEYARTNPGDIYHYEVRDTTEVESFQASAAETAAQMERERAFDRSTVDGHYTAPKNMGGGMAPMGTEAPMMDPTAPAMTDAPVMDSAAPMATETPMTTDAPVMEETPVDGVPTEEIPTEEIPTEEVPMGEEVIEEVPADDEEIIEDEEIVEDDEEDKLPITSRYNRILRRIMASK